MKLKSLGKVLGVALACSLPVACGAELQGQEPERELATTENPLFFRQDLRWTNFLINVCWIDEDGTSLQHHWVRDAITNSYQAHTDLIFRHWGRCTTGLPNALRIQVSRDRTNTTSESKLGIRARDAADYGIKLNLATNENLIRAAAIHEFGHALGALHEMGRLDNKLSTYCNEFQWKSWEAEYSKSIDGKTANASNAVAIGPYDIESVMNYCTDYLGTLSASDIAGMQRYYGKRATRSAYWSTETAQASTFPVNGTLRANQSLTSTGGEIRLVMQGDGNLVLLRRNYPLWSTATKSAGAYAVFQGDGNLVVFSAANKPIWHSNSYGNPNASLTIRNEGDLVIRRSGDSQTVWSSNSSEVSDVYGAGVMKPGWTYYNSVDPVVETKSKAFKLMLTGGALSVRDRSNAILWSSPTSTAVKFNLDRSGSLILRNLSDEIVWRTHHHGFDGALGVLREDGNFVLYHPAKFEVWSARVTPGFQPFLGGGGTEPLLMSELSETWTRGQQKTVEGHTLAFQTDGNLVLYVNQSAVWSSHYAATNGSKLVLQADGNLVMYDAASNPIWSSGTYGYPHSYLSITPQGHLSIYRIVTSELDAIGSPLR